MESVKTSKARAGAFKDLCMHKKNIMPQKKWSAQLTRVTAEMI